MTNDKILWFTVPCFGDFYQQGEATYVFNDQ